jgi:hypothetical protein
MVATILRLGYRSAVSLHVRQGNRANRNTIEFGIGAAAKRLKYMVRLRCQVAE